MAPFTSFVQRLDYPMYVVTAAADGERSGCLVGFAGQCSLEPPRFTVWISKANHTYGVARRAAFLAVHLLPADRHDLARLFGAQTGDEVDKFAGISWTPGPGGAPVLTEALAWFAGRIEHQADWGDHLGFSLAPVSGGPDEVSGRSGQPRSERPLSFRDVDDIQAGHPA